MTKYRLSIVFLCFLLYIFIFPSVSLAEFYKYVDKNGVQRFADDIGNIPAEYRNQIKKITERLDDLSDDEKSRIREKERREAGERNAREKARKDAEAEAKRKRLAEKGIVTKVRIVGNQVLVPVVLAYGRYQIDAQLLLDTGASVTVVHRDKAIRMSMRGDFKTNGQVVGGANIRVDMGTLKFIKVGDMSMENIQVAIIEHRGRSLHNGLLGMNFLKGLKYEIDFERQIIIWKP